MNVVTIRRMRFFLLAFLLSLGTARAEVYKCVVAGKTSYTDRPCDAAAMPADLPPLNTMQRKPGDDLAKSYDERLGREKKSRQQADADFLKQHAAKSAREKRIRSAIINHQVVSGMTPSEVESALGSADEKLPEGAWRYRRDGQRITVTFKDGQVSGLSTVTEKKNK